MDQKGHHQAGAQGPSGPLPRRTLPAKRTDAEEEADKYEDHNWFDQVRK